MLSPEKLAQWKALCDKATSEPWLTNVLIDPFAWEICGPIKGRLFEIEEKDSQDRANIDFVLCARTALPEAIAEIRRLQILVEELESFKCNLLHANNLNLEECQSYRDEIARLQAEIRNLRADRKELRELLDASPRDLSAYAFKYHGSDAKIYNGIYDLETQVQRLQSELQRIQPQPDTFAPGTEWKEGK